MDGVFEHIAIVTFGHETRVHQHMTCDYIEVMRKIRKLTIKSLILACDLDFSDQNNNKIIPFCEQYFILLNSSFLNYKSKKIKSSCLFCLIIWQFPFTTKNKRTITILKLLSIVRLTTFILHSLYLRHHHFFYFPVAERLRPGGPSPMFAGVVMCHAAMLGAGSQMNINLKVFFHIMTPGQPVLILSL